MIIGSSYVLDKKKLFVLLSVLFLLSSFLWFKVEGQEAENLVSESLEAISQDSIEIASEQPIIIDIDVPIEGDPGSSLEDFEATDINSSLEDINQNNTVNSNQDLVPLIIYDDGTGKKEIETKIEENREISITKVEEIDSSTSQYFEKDITVSSDEHFERALTVYSDIPEEEFSHFELYWNNEEIEVTEESSFNLRFYDSNSNGLYDRISFVVPHLSEQNFEIRIFYQTYNSENITLSAISQPPYTILANQSLAFNFSIGYSNISSVFCEMGINRGLTNVYLQSGFINQFNLNVSSLSNANYSWNLFCKDYYIPINNASISGSFEVALNYTPRIFFNSNLNNIQPGQGVNFYANISTQDNRNLFYTLFFGEGAPIGPTSTTNLNSLFTHAYNSQGNYTASLIVVDGNTSYTSTLHITVLNSSSQSSNSGGILDVSLLSPSNNAVLDDDYVNFTYVVQSNVSITNCTFNLYYFNNSGLGVMVYHETNYSVSLNRTDVVTLSQFDNGDYSWEVECYDSERKYDSADRDLSYYTLSNFSSQYSLTSLNDSYERKEEIESLISDIDNFLEESDNYGAEEKEVMELLGTSENLLSFKRKLNQFKQDLRHNINFIKSDKERDERKKQIFAEIDNITEQIPHKIEVIKSEEYVKNSIDANLDDLISEYVGAENLIMSKGSMKKLAKHNKELQSSLTVSVKARHVKVEYEDRESELTLLVKSLDFTGQKDNKFLEVIPESLKGKFSEIKFLNRYEYLNGSSLFLISGSELMDNRIVYYFDSFIPLTELKSLDTLLFSEKNNGDAGLFTGFAILTDSGDLSSFAIYFSWAIFILIFVFAGLFTARRFSDSKYSRNDEVIAIRSLISESQKFLKLKDLSLAKDNYERIKELYSILPIEAKKAIYKPVNGLLLDIDKLEATCLIKECIDSLTGGRKEDALLIYERIQNIYVRMPDRYKEKIRLKISPYLYLFRKA